MIIFFMSRTPIALLFAGCIAATLLVDALAETENPREFWAFQKPVETAPGNAFRVRVER